jgi:hypothetical protein
MKKMLIVFLLLSSSTAYALPEINMAQVYTSLVDQWREEIKNAFEQAEKLIYNVVPNPDEDLLIPDEDPAKCPCKGTGTIKQGDGHETECPFHSSEFQEASTDVLTDPPLVKVNRIICECDTRCACNDCQCQKTTMDLWLKKEIK